MHILIRPLRLVAAAAAALLLAACGGDDTVAVGSADFDEAEIVAAMYAAVLEDAGYDVERRFLFGPRETYFAALTDGELDLVPEYAGSALEFLTGGAGEATANVGETVERLRDHLAEEELTALEPAEAENANTFVVTSETAEEYGLETVSDLQPVAGDLVLGGPPECPERPLCLIGLEEVYGIEFRDFQPLDAGGPVTIGALEGGDIDVALLFTTEPAIQDNDWIMLEDDGGLQPVENIIPVVRDDTLDDDIAERLNAVSERLTTEEISALNARVRLEGADPQDVAEDWLAEQGLLS
jgi:osmoprotectant transport system substrate-binding protein